MKKWGAIVAVILIAFVAYWSFIIEGKDRNESWILFKGFSFFIIVAYLLILLMRFIIKSRIQPSVKRIKNTVAEIKINKWANEDPVWDYRFMMEKATTAFTNVMSAKTGFNTEPLKAITVPAIFEVIKEDIESLKEKGEDLSDLVIEGSGIIGAENKEGTNGDNFEAIFMGSYKKGRKNIRYSTRLGFVRNENNWLLNTIQN